MHCDVISHQPSALALMRVRFLARDGRPPARQDPATFTGSDVRIRDPDLPLLHFAVAFRGAAWTDPDSIALMVMQTMIGAWDKNAGSGAAPPELG